jgi:hypothetical protein
MKRKVIVRIEPDGSMTVDHVGFQGEECLRSSSDLEQALGGDVDRELKEEFHERGGRDPEVFVTGH